MVTNAWTGFGMVTDVTFTCCPPEPVFDFADDRYNEKAWARWFREFLEELLGGRMESAGSVVAADVHRRSPSVTARSGTQRREWKMKLWKQNLRMEAV
jgi:hypothetical protein